MPQIDWGGGMAKGLLMGAIMFLHISWPYLLFFAIFLYAKRRYLSGTSAKPRAQEPIAHKEWHDHLPVRTVVLDMPTPPPAHCALCGKPVSIKVENYCRTHEARFRGRIYCYNHQKLV